MRWNHLLSCVAVLALACMIGGCSGGDETGQTGSQETPEPAVEVSADATQVAAADPAAESTEPEPESLPVEQSEPEVTALSESTPESEQESQTTLDAQIPDVPETPPASVDDLAGEVVAVAATKDGLTYVGDRKCRLCHRAEHESWAASAHAGRVPPLDCEGCHGPGSEFSKRSIMKVPALAKAAGLVMPDKAFCTSTCHGDDWQDDLMTRSHAHKDDTP